MDTQKDLTIEVSIIGARMILEEKARYDNTLHGYLTLPTTNWEGGSRYSVFRKELEEDLNAPNLVRPREVAMIVLSVERNWHKISTAKEELQKLSSNLGQLLVESRGFKEGRSKALETFNREHPSDQKNRPTFVYVHDDRAKEIDNQVREMEAKEAQLKAIIADEKTDLYEVPVDLKGVRIIAVGDL